MGEELTNLARTAGRPCGYTAAGVDEHGGGGAAQPVPGSDLRVVLDQHAGEIAGPCPFDVGGQVTAADRDQGKRPMQAFAPLGKLLGDVRCPTVPGQGSNRILLERNGNE
jgi:hypothetical protein